MREYISVVQSKALFEIIWYDVQQAASNVSGMVSWYKADSLCPYFIAYR
jgi:hypothetical protein